MVTPLNTLAATADALYARGPYAGFAPAVTAIQVRRELDAAFRLTYPAAAAAADAARAAGHGKKSVVAAAAAAILDLEDPVILEALDTVTRAQSWPQARRALLALGFAGELIARPQLRGLRLPCSAHACPSSWGTNWGLHNAQAVCTILLRRAQPVTSGPGWHLARA